MILDDAVLRDQFLKLNKQTNPVHWQYTAEFIDSDNNIIKAHNVNSLHKFSNYSEDTADNYFISLSVFKTVNMRLQACNPHELRLRLTRIPNTVSGTTDRIGNRIVETYNAYLTDTSSEAVETRPGALTGQRTDNMGELVEIDVQLVESGLSEFRLYDIGGNYRNVKVDTLLQGLMSHPLRTLSDTGDAGYGVTIVPAHNKDRYYQLFIPNGVHLIDLPGWVQKHYGVYSSDIGYYLTQGMWYIYPLNDFNRFNTVNKRMTIINVPKNEMMGLNNSYLNEGGHITVYATGDTTHINQSNRNLDKSGEGLISGIMGNMLDHFTETSEGKCIIAAGRNLVKLGFDLRAGNLTNVKAVSGLLSSNPWHDTSKVISTLGSTIIVTWESSNPYLLYPGMPVRFLYKDRGKLLSLMGTLKAAETLTMTQKKSVVDNYYVSTTKLTIFAKTEEMPTT